MDNLKVMQVVGYKDSGKTTLLTYLVEQLSKEQINVAVIKHHGHGGSLDQPNDHTDSMQYLKSGANSSLVFDDSLIQLHVKQQDNQLLKALELVQRTKPQLVFIEGMKSEHYPKLVLLRNKEDWTALQTLSHIAAVITRDHVEINGVICMQRDNKSAIYQFLRKWMDGEQDEAI